MTALTNPKKALDKICDIGNELNISVTKEEVIEYLSTIDDEATKMWLSLIHISEPTRQPLISSAASDVYKRQLKKTVENLTQLTSQN